MAWIGCPSCSKSVQDTATSCPHCGAALKSAGGAPVVPAGPQITCEKCKTGSMWQTRVAKFSDALRIIGFTLWVPAVLLLAGSTVMVCVTAGAGGSTAIDQAAKARNEGANRLSGVRLMPDAIVEDFRADGLVEETTLITLSEEHRAAIRQEMSSYGATVAGSAIGSGMIAGAGGCGLIAAYFVLVPTMIVGFVLTLKKNVWRCQNCGYIYDRA